MTLQEREQSRGAKMAVRMYPLLGIVCEECMEKPAVHRHHIDRNKIHNHRENIRFLCAKCHRGEHSFEWHKRGEVGPRLTSLVHHLLYRNNLSYKKACEIAVEKGFRQQGWVSSPRALSAMYSDKYHRYMRIAEFDAWIGLIQEVCDLSLSVSELCRFFNLSKSSLQELLQNTGRLSYILAGRGKRKLKLSEFCKLRALIDELKSK